MLDHDKDKPRDDETAEQYIEGILKKKEIGIKDLLLGGAVMYGMIPWVSRKLKVSPYVDEYKEITKQETEFILKGLNELDDDELIEFQQQIQQTEEMYENQLAREKTTQRILDIIRKRTKEAQEKKDKVNKAWDDEKLKEMQDKLADNIRKEMQMTEEMKKLKEKVEAKDKEC